MEMGEQYLNLCWIIYHINFNNKKMRIQAWERFEGGEERWEKINIYSPNLYFLNCFISI